MGKNNKKLTTEEFIERAKEVHENKYDYSLTDYINSKIKVKIICPTHGIFEQQPNNHLYGQGCIQCADRKLLTTEEFIERAKEVHGNKYDYSLVNYINGKTKIKIICPIHGVFEQKPRDHSTGKGCLSCSGKEKLSREEFIERAKEVHGNKFDYSLVEYINAKTKVKIKCNDCGTIIEQNPHNHLIGKACAVCSGIAPVSTKEFIERAKEVHRNKYDYLLTEYTGADDKVKIICKKHGLFEQNAYSHISGCGCPKCKNSQGENRMIKILETNNILFEEQKKFDNCKYKNRLPFDFYLPEYNVLIEVQGVQHFKPLDFFGGEEALKTQQLRDEIKKEYCLNNNIPLLEFTTNETRSVESATNKLLDFINNWRF